MAFATSSRTTNFPLLERIEGFFASIRDSIRFEQTYRRTHAELSALTTRELDDLGIARADIPWIALESAKGNPRPQSPSV